MIRVIALSIAVTAAFIFIAALGRLSTCAVYGFPAIPCLIGAEP